MNTSIFQLIGCASPWGDYGDLLLNGMVTGPVDTEEAGEVSVLRTGPFVPPISFPFGATLVTEEFRTNLETMGYTGLKFQSVRYERVVDLDWQNWDLSADEPDKYPSGGEPENYILGRKHNQAVAAKMPKLSAVIAAPICDLQKIGTSSIYKGKLPDLDVFRANMLVFVSERVQRYLHEKVGNWVECVPANIVSE